MSVPDPSSPESVAAWLSGHRADQVAVEASDCYAADTCTLDLGCPFVVSCVASLDSLGWKP